MPTRDETSFGETDGALIRRSHSRAVFKPRCQWSRASAAANASKYPTHQSTNGRGVRFDERSFGAGVIQLVFGGRWPRRRRSPPAHAQQAGGRPARRIRGSRPEAADTCDSLHQFSGAERAATLLMRGPDRHEIKPCKGLSDANRARD